MEQIAEIQAPASQDQVKVLTELVQQLLRKNEKNQEPEDPYVTTRAPVTDLKACPELTEALPSIEEDFFLSPLTEEERKISIHSCPRTSSMNYNPPQLNDSASTSVKKADTALYGIQDNPGLDTSEYPEVMFERTMRALLSDVAATVTQARLDNLNKGLEIPEKPTQLVEPDTKPLMDQEALDSLISKKPAAKRQRVQPFRKRQQSSNNKNSISINIATAQSTNAATTAEANTSNRTTDRHQESHQGDTAQGSRLLQPAVHDPEKYWRPQTSIRPPQAQPTCGGAELQDGDPVFHLPHGPQKRLFDVPRPTGCIHAYPGIQAVSEVPTLSLEWPLFPVSGPTIRVITEPIGFHQDSSPSLTMGQVPRNANLSIFGRPTNHGRIQRGVCENHTQDILQALGAWIQDQRRKIVYVPITIYHTSVNGNKHPGNDAEGSDNQDPGPSTRDQQNSECWPDDIEMSSELYWESSSNVNRSPAWPPNASTTPAAQELHPVDIEIMDFDSETDEPSYPEPIILEEPAEIMERSLILSRYS
ncbi:hypothetical protein AYI70_g5335 [Smittium culicis]|uniref:Uncharacterized protein n=1 Tax=Smittium culicis TaxID=133412 RepID=A0A1R1XV14_9FUNG|nr:hypothetical protein AYI70_g5335 [Smittium culicis]